MPQTALVAYKHVPNFTIEPSILPILNDSPFLGGMMPYFDMSQFDVFVDFIHDPSLSPYLIPKFLHSSYTIGCLNHYCMHCMGPSNFEWSASRVLPPHEVVLGCTGLSLMTVL